MRSAIIPCFFVAMMVVTPLVAAMARNLILVQRTHDRSCQECFDSAARGDRPFADGSCNHCNAPMLGPGRVRCDSWSLHKAASTEERAKDVSWLLGFVSGYNQFDANPTKAFFLRYDERSVVDVIDRECAIFPEMPVAEIVIKFIR